MLVLILAVLCLLPTLLLQFPALLCLLLARLGVGRGRSHRRARSRPVPVHAAPTNLRARKPDWVAPTVLALCEHTSLSHRKLADAFNRLYFARTGVSVGRTWVRHLLAQQSYRAVHLRQQFKHRTVIHWLGIRLRFSQPASPWQNGRIERFFGTLKGCLQGLRFDDATPVRRGLEEFRHYYNHVRGHQHLGGRTPAEA